MRIVHNYIFKSFLTTFLLAMLLLTFVMTIGILFQSVKYIARGMDMWTLMTSLARNLPGTMTYTMPLAALVSSLLVFSRLSSDSEISALRSCGIPLRNIMWTPILFSVFLSLICFFINNDLAPDAALSRLKLRKQFKLEDVTALIEPGSWVEINDIRVYVARRDGDFLYNVNLTQKLPDGLLREMRAESAVIRENAETGDSFLSLQNVTIFSTGKTDNDGIQSKTWDIPLQELTAAAKGEAKAQEQAANAPAKIKRRIKDRYSWELLRDIIVSRSYPPKTRDDRKNLTRALTELTSRVTFALACFCFVFVGIPLGLQNHRRESSKGIAISLVIAGSFYLFCLTGESLAKNPDLNASWIVFVPVPVCIVLGHYLLRIND